VIEKPKNRRSAARNGIRQRLHPRIDLWQRITFPMVRLTIFNERRWFVQTKILLECTVGLLLGADAKDDQKKLQGKWMVTSGVIDGNEIPKDQIKGDVTYSGDKYTWTFGEADSGGGAFKIDPSKKPKAMDSVPSDGPVKGQTVEQIYEIDGDTLKVCFAMPGNKRPTEFKSAAGSGLWLFTYKRAK